MASTYVNDLRLNEMATGDQSGSWGTVTNLNLELIGEAFSYGTEAITTNADTHTTTIADGAADAGRSMFLKYTGTLDSACTITIGPNTVSKVWFIENSTSGSQNIIISQGSGANVTIAAGQTKAVYSDGAGSGAAFVDAFSSLNVAGVSPTELAVLDGITATTAEINILDGVTATTAELNILDGVTATTAELNYNDITTLGVVQASKTVTADSSGNVRFSDADVLQFGTSADLQLYHSGSHSHIHDAGTGNLYLDTNGTGISLTYNSNAENMITATGNGAVTLYHDNAAKLATFSGGVSVTGSVNADGLSLGDGDIANFGNSNDLQISHNGSDSIIAETGTGNLYIRGSSNIFLQKADASETFIATADDGAVTLYYNNAAKLATNNSGITVTGTINSGDLRGEAWIIGRDSNDYIAVDTNKIDFSLDDNIDMRLENDGDLHVDGNVIAYSTTISDERLKTDIVKIDGALDKVAQLNGYTFTYTADGKKSAGVIAQEVQKVLPSAITESTLPLKMGDDDQTEYMTVQYDQLMGLMIEAIKELKAEVAELKGK